MRVWNPRNSSTPGMPFRVLELPMRVWNRTFSCLREWFCVLELPMRVWNPIECRLHADQLRFGVTYEGLKRSSLGWKSLSPFAFWSYLWGFETYDPDTQDVWAVSFWSYLWGFETNKPFLLYTMHWNVLELPMRVWNARPDGRPGLRRNWFWSYLWGFETHSSSSLSPARRPVLELPMRVWNWSCGCRCAASKGFWSYLWGFETQPRPLAPETLPLCFGVTYEGLKLL